MQRETARRLHGATNLTYWFSNEQWSIGNSLVDGALKATRPFWRATNSILLASFFDTDKVIAVSGETVVAAGDNNTVDKYMFRYPDNMAIEVFEERTRDEVKTVTGGLGSVAIPTTVSVKPAFIFRNPNTSVEAVTQQQQRLELRVHEALDLERVTNEGRSPLNEKTARDLETLALGARRLIEEHGYYPDIARSGGNLRRSTDDGAVTLIDVLPFYENGSRLIGDRPTGVIAGIERNLVRIEDFAGAYGS